MQIQELIKGDSSSGQVSALFSSFLLQQEGSTAVYFLILKNKPCLSIVHLFNVELEILSKEN